MGTEFVVKQDLNLGSITFFVTLGRFLILSEPNTFICELG